MFVCIELLCCLFAASTKRSHDWVSSGGGGEQMNHRQASSSPVRGGIAMSTQSGAVVREAVPLSPPSSSNVSIKKKIVSKHFH